MRLCDTVVAVSTLECMLVIAFVSKAWCFFNDWLSQSCAHDCATTQFHLVLGTSIVESMVSQKEICSVSLSNNDDLGFSRNIVILASNGLEGATSVERDLAPAEGTPLRARFVTKVPAAAATFS